jgi:hypothetical protein
LHECAAYTDFARHGKAQSRSPGVPLGPAHPLGLAPACDGPTTTNQDVIGKSRDATVVRWSTHDESNLY